MERSATPPPFHFTERVERGHDNPKASTAPGEALSLRLKVEPGSKAGLADHPWNDIHHTMAAPSANVRFRMPEGVDVGASASKDIRPIASRIAFALFVRARCSNG